MTTLTFEFLPPMNLMISCQGTVAATDADFDRYLEALRDALRNPNKFLSLVVTDGAYPTRDQQKRMTQIVAGNRPRVAIVSGSAALRFVTSTFSLLNPNMQCFDSTACEAALAYLGLGPIEMPTVMSTIASLRTRLSVEPRS